MCMLFLFMIYYKCIFIRFHEDKYSMDFFKKKNIKKLKIINNKTINIIYAVLLFIKMNLTDEKSVFFMPFFKNKGGNKMEKEILKLLGEKDGEFFEGDVSGDTIILYSRIEKLFLKLQETIQKLPVPKQELRLIPVVAAVEQRPKISQKQNMTMKSM